MFERSLEGLLFQVVRLVGTRSEWPFDDLTLSLSECMLLFALLDGGELSQQDLAASINVDKSRAIRLGSVLERRGWIDRVRDPTNRRGTHRAGRRAGRARPSTAGASAALTYR